MLAWWSVSLTGVIASYVQFRRVQRRWDMLPPELQFAHAPELLMKRIAISRLVSFSFVFLVAPVVYNMFRFPPGSNWGTYLPVTMPFWVFFISNVTVVVANVIGLLLLLRDMRNGPRDKTGGGWR